MVELRASLASYSPEGRLRIAFGPEMPDFGSWEWVGAAMAESLGCRYSTVTFRDEVPDCDAVVFVKFHPDAATARGIAKRARILYCPVDAYGSGSEIDRDSAFLAQCDRVLVHCRRLVKWFAPYARTEYVDHHLRFVAPLRSQFRSGGPLLWVGVHSNLGPLVRWANQHSLPDELWVLTNAGAEEPLPTASDFGFHDARKVRIERWTPERQLEWTGLARAALDIKGSDFRQRHKPPVKALDFVASGMPFAINAESSAAEHLAGLGFRAASPDDSDRWLSQSYFEETIAFGRRLPEILSRECVAGRWDQILSDMLGADVASGSAGKARRGISLAAPAPHEFVSRPASEAESLPERPTRIAILSLLFNWPSTGGGTIHTFETAKFLSQAGYEVRHIYARFEGWGVGNVTQPLASDAQVLEFDESTWTADAIRDRFRHALEAFGPDHVIITDSWNTKPLLAEAAAGFPYSIRLAALECLCPLNNVRLLVDDAGRPTSCPRQQLDEASACRACVRKNERLSGSLHQAERELAGFGQVDYPERLKTAFAKAASVLVVNPAIAEMMRPHARAVHVIPSGFDPGRFDLKRLDAHLPARKKGRSRIFFAGLTQEYMKGFAVLHSACDRLWRVRKDFELVATGDPAGTVDEFTGYVGWLSQDELPRHLRAADILVFPTIAEEALGRSAVEAMACGRPVVASRIGGLVHTVQDGETGLLFEPGNVFDLLTKLVQLLDHPDLRQQLGAAGRRRFESTFTWDVILKHYVQLFGPATRREALRMRPPAEDRPAALEHVTLPRVGCVLAIQDRSPEVLSRTLQTYGFQTIPPVDRVLVDFGSQQSLSAEYQRLCDEHGWRFFRVGPVGRPWSLSAAYNLAVSHLHPDVEIVFKSDVDVLLGSDVLERAARHGRSSLCLFSCMTTCEGAVLPDRFESGEQVEALRRIVPPVVPMDGEGIHAYPRRWFEEIGGFDRTYSGWGFEDSDLRLRASWSIGVHHDTEALLVHQWHPRAVDGQQSVQNDRYYQSTKTTRQLVRNGGQLVPEEGATLAVSPNRKRDKVVVATRSLHEPLYRMSAEFLEFGGTFPARLRPTERYRFVGTDAEGYFKELARIDADWVVNLDEDAFVLDPLGLVRLIEHMEERGYAACGMPDGGVVPIRRHNPLACNAFFNVFDMARVRSVWSDWDRVMETDTPTENPALFPSFARRSERAFDRFEPYYPAFFSLLQAGQRILWLDAETWKDGVSTLLKGLDGRPLLIHCWYAREWAHDASTRQRYARVQEFARSWRNHAMRPASDLASPSRSISAADVPKGGLSL